MKHVVRLVIVVVGLLALISLIMLTSSKDRGEPVTLHLLSSTNDAAGNMIGMFSVSNHYDHFIRVLADSNGLPGGPTRRAPQSSWKIQRLGLDQLHRVFRLVVLACKPLGLGCRNGVFCDCSKWSHECQAQCQLPSWKRPSGGSDREAIESCDRNAWNRHGICDPSTAVCAGADRAVGVTVQLPANPSA